MVCRNLKLILKLNLISMTHEWVAFPTHSPCIPIRKKERKKEKKRKIGVVIVV